MKFQLTFKTPDVISQIEDAEEHQEEIGSVLSKFLQWEEYIKVEFDTELKTAEVVRCR